MPKAILFCFPYAGGSESIFYKWRHQLKPGLELYPIEYAGRGKRFQDHFYPDMEHAKQDILNRIRPVISSENYIFFGHSLGGIIAYELCKQIAIEGCNQPLHLFASAVAAPGRYKSRMLHRLPDDEFKQKILEFNGTPAELLEYPEFADIFLPILRADFKLIETYQASQERFTLSCGITAIYGSKDSIGGDDMLKWKEYTSAQFQMVSLPGDHFYIRSHEASLLEIINHVYTARRESFIRQ